MKTKHITGPWALSDEANENIFGEGISLSILDAEGFPIADVDCSPILHNWHIKYPEMHHWAEGAKSGLTQCERTPDEVLATARLISAAPDMLKSLIEIRALLERNGMSSHQIPEYSTLASAIAKATGNTA